MLLLLLEDRRFWNLVLQRASATAGKPPILEPCGFGVLLLLLKTTESGTLWLRLASATAGRPSVLEPCGFGVLLLLLEDRRFWTTVINDELLLSEDHRL